MKNTNETRDNGETNLCYTYETLIQSTSIDPSNKYIGLEGYASTHDLTELLTHVDQITRINHWRTHHEDFLIDNMSYNGCPLWYTITKYGWLAKCYGDQEGVGHGEGDGKWWRLGWSGRMTRYGSNKSTVLLSFSWFNHPSLKCEWSSPWQLNTFQLDARGSRVPYGASGWLYICCKSNQLFPFSVLQLWLYYWFINLQRKCICCTLYLS